MLPPMRARASAHGSGRGPRRKARPIGLAALRGFEAAARRLSFTLAADELSLTQSSISRQVASLERQLGKALFVRHTRALELTPAGRALMARLGRIAEAFQAELLAELGPEAEALDRALAKIDQRKDRD